MVIGRIGFKYQMKINRFKNEIILTIFEYNELIKWKKKEPDLYKKWISEIRKIRDIQYIVSIEENANG